MLCAWWTDMRDDALEWCRGQSWIWRIPVLLWVAYFGSRPLIEPLYSDMLIGPVSMLTLAIHELGHVIFRPFGEFLMIAGGSITQVVVPALSIVMFVRQRDYFAVCFGGAWLSLSLCDLATYIADSRAMQLPLVSLGDNAIHDWNYLLNATNLLAFDTQIATFTRCIAFCVLLPSLAVGVWTLFWMMRRREEAEDCGLPY